MGTEIQTPDKLAQQRALAASPQEKAALAKARQTLIKVARDRGVSVAKLRPLVEDTLVLEWEIGRLAGPPDATLRGKSNSQGESFTSADLEMEKSAVTRCRYIGAAFKDEADVRTFLAATPATEIATRNRLVTEAYKRLRPALAEAPDLPEGVFRVLYADPPWQYGDTRASTRGGARDQYPTMSTEELCDLDVLNRGAEDSVLFLWAVVPLLPDALLVMQAWGFAYKTCFVWDKGRGSMGHYSSVQHELLLLGTRGSCVPHKDKLPQSILRVGKTEHSVKPEVFRELVDFMYPDGPRLELFARRQPPGSWKAWGNEA